MLVLRPEQKLQVVQRVIDNDYDITEANELRERFRKERLLDFCLTSLEIPIPLLPAGGEGDLAVEAPADRHQATGW